MGYFPFFVELKRKRGLIVGGGIVAERKVRKLLPYEPELLVVAPEIDDGIRKLSEEVKEKRTKNEDTSELILFERDFETTDLEKMDFVIAATSDEALNTRIAKLCEEKHILVNVVDDKEKCGFLFPSLIREGKLSIGISTEGASPRVATTFRTRLSADIPERELLLFQCLPPSVRLLLHFLCQRQMGHRLLTLQHAHLLLPSLSAAY